MSIYTDSIADDKIYSNSDWMRSEGYEEEEGEENEE